MSKGLFANPKAALAFAGVTVGIAVLASFGMGSMVPENPDARIDTSPEIEAAQAETAAAKRAAADARRAQEPRLAWNGKKRASEWGANEHEWAEVEDGWSLELQNQQR